MLISERGDALPVTYHDIRSESSDCGTYTPEPVHPIIASDDKPGNIILEILRPVYASGNSWKKH